MTEWVLVVVVGVALCGLLVFGCRQGAAEDAARGEVPLVSMPPIQNPADCHCYRPVPVFEPPSDWLESVPPMPARPAD
jgi:hypothetical protein